MKKTLLRFAAYGLYLACVGATMYVRFILAPANSTENYLLVTFWPIWLAVTVVSIFAFILAAMAENM